MDDEVAQEGLLGKVDRWSRVHVENTLARQALAEFLGSFVLIVSAIIVDHRGAHDGANSIICE